MRAYSLDLRNKVMETYHQTKHKSNICKQFKIARSTLDEWIKLEQETSNLQPLPPISKGRPFTIKDLDEFEKFINTTPYRKLKDLLQPFEQKFGYKISYSILWRGVQKINSRKRNK